MDYFAEAGSRNYAGAQINNVIADSLDRLSQTYGADLENLLLNAGIDGTSQGNLQAARAAALRIERIDNGGIGIAADYWNLAARSTTPQSEPALHDMCTKSLDVMPIQSGFNKYVAVDLRGPCSKHDMCYEKNRGNDWEMMVCDNQFRRNILTVCDNVFPGAGSILSRRDCKSIGWTYYWAVAAAHREHYF